jgi:predicted transcriptional regulator
MERLCDLNFELSNEDRLVMLYRLEEDSMNVTTLARELDITTQECSRHITRLSEARLVEKDPEGIYGLTQYGRLLLKMIPGQAFIAENREYFNTHTLEKLPSELVCRIGELHGSRLTQDVTVTFGLVESLFKNAEEQICMIHDRYLLNILSWGTEAVKRGVKIKSLDTPPKEPDRSLDHGRPAYISEDDEDFFIVAWLDGKLETRNSDAVDVFLYFSEKEAVVAFPLSDGTFDYLGFSSEDQAALGYCRDLFGFYFERGEVPTKDKVYELRELRKKIHREKTSR